MIDDADPLMQQRDPYDPINHAAHLREADRMHGELLRQCGLLMDAEAGTQEAEDLRRLSQLVADYEEVRWDIDKAISKESP